MSEDETNLEGRASDPVGECHPIVSGMRRVQHVTAQR